MARFRRRSSRGYLGRKRNVDRKLPCGYSDVAPSTQQYAYNFTATTACTIKSIKLDIGANVTNEGTGQNCDCLCFSGCPPKGIMLIHWFGPQFKGDLYNPTMDVLISGVLTDTALEDHKSI